MNRRWIFAAVGLAACGGARTAGSARPANTPALAVTSFLQAVTDSNTDKMAMLWGTAAGPAGRTHQPSDYARRIAVMQAYLRHDDFRIVNDAPQGETSRHLLEVQLRRSACTWTIPFVTVQLGEGNWIVNQVDLTSAGNPSRPCTPSDSASAPAP